MDRSVVGPARGLQLNGPFQQGGPFLQIVALWLLSRSGALRGPSSIQITVPVLLVHRQCAAVRRERSPTRGAADCRHNDALKHPGREGNAPAFDEHHGDE